MDVQHRPQGSAPWLFTLVAREFPSLIHTQNTALHQFLDDWLGQAKSKVWCAEDRDLVLLLCKELGWIVNLEKSELVPQQVFAFVGIQYHLISFTAHPTLENWIKVVRAAQSLTQASSLPAVAWQSVIGILQGQSHLVPFGRLHVRPLQWNLSRFWNQFRDPQTIEVPVLEGSRYAAGWWLDQDPSIGTPVTFTSFSYRLFMDACPMGWGG